MRISYQAKYNELKLLVGEEFQQSFCKEFEERIANMKKYILDGKEFLKEVKHKEKIEESVKAQIKKRSRKFLINEAIKLLKSLQEEVAVKTSDISDEEVIRRKQDLNFNSKRMDSMSRLIKDLLDFSQVDDYEMSTSIKKLMWDYEKLCIENEMYVQNIKIEAQDRELSKPANFNESKLKINLPKFSGYESKLDIYTFQSEFTKVYERTTPKRVLPDILKNNLLEGAALSLVSSVKILRKCGRELKQLMEILNYC